MTCPITCKDLIIKWQGPRSKCGFNIMCKMWKCKLQYHKINSYDVLSQLIAMYVCFQIKYPGSQYKILPSDGFAFKFSLYVCNISVSAVFSPFLTLTVYTRLEELRQPCVADKRLLMFALLQWRHMGMLVSQITHHSAICSTYCQANLKESIKDQHDPPFVRRIHR